MPHDDFDTPESERLNTAANAASKERRPPFNAAQIKPGAKPAGKLSLSAMIFLSRCALADLCPPLQTLSHIALHTL